MENLGYYNGTYGLISEISLPITDRGFYFGDGIYDATYARNHIPFTLDEHIARFYRSAAALDIKLTFSEEELSALICRMTKKVDDGETFIYFQATRGTSYRDHAYSNELKSNLAIMIRPKKIMDLTERVRARTDEDTRFFHCNIKTINLIPNVMYAKRAKEEGCYETILHREGFVTECAHSNVGILKDGEFITAPVNNLILEGIARAHIIKECGRLNIKVIERRWRKEELFDADEVIISSAGTLCMGVSVIDGITVGGKADGLLRTLQKNLLREFWQATEE